MNTILTIEGVGHDLEALRDLLREHGYAVGTVSESAGSVEQVLRAFDQRLRNIFEHAPLGIFRSTLDGKLLTANPTFARMFKYDSPEQLMEIVNSTGLGDTIYSNAGQRLKVLSAIQASDKWQVYEGPFRCKDGSFIECCMRLRKAPDAQTEIEGFIEDISERKRAERLLRFTQYVVDNTADQAFWLTEDARVFYVNAAACRALGYTRDELIGMSIHDFDPCFSAEEFPQGWEKLRAGGSRTLETCHRTKDGRVYPVEVRVNYVKFDGKEYHCTFVTDISERKAVEDILRQSEKRHRQLMELLPIAAFTTDAEGRITFFNRNAVALWGREPELNRDRWCGAYRLWYPDGRPMPFDDCPMALTLKHGKRYQGQEMLIESVSGGYSHVVVYPEPLYDPKGKLLGALNLLVDITRRKQVEKQLLQSNLVVENSPVILFRWKAEPGWPVDLVSKNITQFGYSPEEFLSGALAFFSIIHPGDRERVAREVEVYTARGVDRFQQEYRILGKGGKVCWVSDQTIVERNGEGQVTHYQGIVLDITERKQAEERIKASLAEKEVLLKEIHHRVKNNLQVVSSLLYLQSQKLQDPEARSLFVESQNRICSMALAHEQLYQSQNLADVSLTHYVKNLVSHVQQAYMTPETPLECRVVIDDIKLDIEKVVPCGLLITELLSNAIRHAFPDGRCGTIEVTITKHDGQVMLSVADDGVGLPENLDYREAQTLGLQLISALVEQLDGSLSVKSGVGTRFTIAFSG